MPQHVSSLVAIWSVKERPRTPSITTMPLHCMSGGGPRQARVATSHQARVTTPRQAHVATYTQITLP